MKALASILAGTAGAMLTSAALAAQPDEWGIWHQEPATQMMASIEWFDAYTFWFITPITLFVLGLLVWVALKFNHKANPTPSKTSHNTMIEVVWTVAPIIILIGIAIPSFQLLEDQLNPQEEPMLTVKVTGQSWYWDYEYQDDSEISYSSNLIGSEYLAGSVEAAQKQREDLDKTDTQQYPRLLAVDNELVVPVNEMIRVLVTAAPEGVIHGFAMPAFGLKLDAIPGRVNETWFKAEKEGLYYGQCSELCGVNHAFMPIAIRVVDRDTFEGWRDAALDDVEGANRAFFSASAKQDNNNTKLAENQSAQ